MLDMRMLGLGVLESDIWRPAMDAYMMIMTMTHT